METISLTEVLTLLSPAALATDGGQLTAVIVVTGVVKWVLGTPKIPLGWAHAGDVPALLTRLVAVATGIVLQLVFVSGPGAAGVILRILRGAAIALVAMKGAELFKDVVGRSPASSSGGV